jgi:hypothetical protein
MPKPHFWLIIIWSVVCASGLAVFLVQIYKPILPVSPDSSGVGVSVAFWIFIWFVPSLIIAAAGLRQRGKR